MQVSASRVVAFVVTPVLTAATAVGTGWLERHFPGLPKVNPTQVVALELAGATAALSACLKWLHGLSQWERAQADIKHWAEQADKAVETVDPGVTQKALAAGETAAEQGAAKLVAVLDNRSQAFPAAPDTAPEAPVPDPVTVTPADPPAPAAA